MASMTTSDPKPNKAILDCPSQEILREYLFGRTDDSLGESIDQHLESCDVCNETIQGLETEQGPMLGVSDSFPAMSDNQILQDAITASRIPTVPHEVPATIGPYRLLKSIGRGGMGEVYRAEHTKLKKIVAIKLLPLYVANAHAVERFEREIQAAGKLSHTAIVNSTDAGVDAGYQYLAMEFIQGFDLGRLGRRIREIPFADVCEMGRQMALGLAHAHSMGMVHRDIKPSNVMLDPNGNIKLLDFGLVLLSQWDSPVGELTTVGQFLGTLDYMAPEQAERSGSVDHRSDLYSLGATLFRLLTGQLPLAMLPNQSPLEKLRALTNHAPIRVQTLRKNLPNELASLVDQLLRTNPKERPASAAHVAESLETFCKGANLVDLVSRAEQIDLPDELLEAHPVANIAGTAGNIGKRSGASWWTVAIAACLPLATYFGINFILEDSRGNLVIQSEVDQVHVRLMKPDGTPGREWQVQQGNSITKLVAGSYEITIDAPSDTVAIDKSTLVIKKGDTVVARIARQDTKPAVAPQTGDSTAMLRTLARMDTASMDTGWLPKGVVPDSLLYADYNGKRVLEHLWSIHAELNYETWLKSLSILEIIPNEHKAALARFVIQSAEEKKFITGPSILRLSEWLTDEEIDARISAEFAKSNEGASELIHAASTRCVEDNDGNYSKSRRKIDWTKLVKMWAFVENWITQGGTERVEEFRMSVRKLTSKIPFTDFLFERFPRTALSICDFNEYNALGMEVRLDPKRHALRIGSLIKLAKDAFDRNAKEDLFFYLAFARAVSKGDDDHEYWQLSSEQIGQYLRDWAATNQPVLSEKIRFRPTQWRYEMEIRTTSGNQRLGFGPGMGGMGGMGGGVFSGMGGGGMGSEMTPPPSANGGGASLSNALLCQYYLIPVEFRPKQALEEVRNMLAKHLGDTNSRANELFPMEWTQLRWNDQFRLEYAELEVAKSFPAEDQDAVEAFALHRWASGLLESDQLDPGTVCYRFVQDLKETGSDSGSSKSRSWIVSRGRGTWPGYPPSATSLHHVQGDFSAEVINTWFRRATVSGRLGQGAPMTFELELEKEGWRFRKAVVSNGTGNMGSIPVDF